jgi:hypothetical protein
VILHAAEISAAIASGENPASAIVPSPPASDTAASEVRQRDSTHAGAYDWIVDADQLAELCFHRSS